MLPAGWLANRNAEVALFWGLLTLLLHERGRRGSLWAAVLAPVALALGLLSNEGALSTCGYLFAYACFLDGAAWRKRIGALAPYAAVVAVWRCAYLWLGYGAWGSPAYLDPAAEPLRYALAALERVPVLLTSLCFTPPADLYLAYPLPIKPFILLWCAAVLTVTAVLLSPLLKRPDSRFLALGMLLALLPACSTEPADRLMPFAAFGGLALIAQFLHAVYHRLIWVRTRAQRAFARTALTVFIITHALVSPLAILCGIPIFHWLMDGIERSAYATELDSSVSAKTIVFTNAPTMFHTAYFPVLRLIEGLPAPAHLRSLAPNSFGGTPMRVRRLDVYTLRVTPEHGYPIILLRNDAHAFAAGDRVNLTGVCVEVLRVNERGVPAEVTFTFDVPLEDASLLWLALRGGAYHPVSPPAIGEEVLWRTAPFVLGRWPKILDNLRRFLGGSC